MARWQQEESYEIISPEVTIITVWGHAKPLAAL